MNQNKVLDKIQEFATTDISLDRFKELLRSSNSSNKMRIKWTTEEGRVRNYWMYWDSGAYVGGDAGGSLTKQLEGMVNLQGDYSSEDWRTLTYDTVNTCRFKNKLYKIR